MTLPVAMVDRWRDRADPGPGEGIVYWHVLMRDQPAVVDLARQAQDRLAGFSGLHMTPLQWLHMTTLVAGPEEEFLASGLQEMTRVAAELLAATPPVRVRLGKIVYHPQAVMLAVTPAEALAPFRRAAVTATRAVAWTGQAASEAASGDAWAPHVTICYSTAEQPAQPIIDALGMRLPECEIEITTLSLVIQRGPELSWDWAPVGAVEVGAGPTGP